MSGRLDIMDWSSPSMRGPAWSLCYTGANTLAVLGNISTIHRPLLGPRGLWSCSSAGDIVASVFPVLAVWKVLLASPVMAVWMVLYSLEMVM